MALLFLILIFAQNTMGEQLDVYEKQKKIAFDTAESLYKDKKYNLAFRHYQDFLELYNEDSYASLVRERIASIYEKKQYYQKAAEMYLELYSANASSMQGGQYLFKAAKLYQYMGLTKKAEIYFNTIRTLMPNSPEARQSEIFLDIEQMQGAKTEF